MPDIRFIERRDKVEVVERLGPFDRGSDLFWREYGWQTRAAELHNGGRPADSLSRQAVHVLDGNGREIKNAADVREGERSKLGRSGPAEARLKDPSLREELRPFGAFAIVIVVPAAGCNDLQRGA